MTANRQCARGVHPHESRSFPPDVANCPRCTGEVWWTETLADTLLEQVAVWVCCDCLATGTLTLTMTVSDARRMGERVAEQWREVA